MKKEYEAPKAEKMTFNYSEEVIASGGCGGEYREYTNNYTGCRTTPTDNWVNPFAAEDH